MSTEYEVIIGLEIHLRLATQSKMYCSSANADSDEPNVHVCPICLGHPGTLPQVNEEAIRLGALMAFALNCEVAEFSKFDRKQYFYPDLPKGYQISQFDQPLARHGYLDILVDDVNPKRVGIERLHLEEDAAKLKHAKGGDTLVDFNRAGAPLAELVTKPDIRSAAEAKLFVQELQQIARYVGASQADMEKGHMRCDANISLRPVGEAALFPKTEVKNMNSFRSIERAIQYEVARQTELWNAGAAPEVTTTRGWDDKRGITVEMRSKEEAADYRYFPEPDIPPITFSSEQLREMAGHVPELPEQRRIRFRDEYELSYHDAKTLTIDPRVGELFENTVSELRAWLNALDDVPGSDEDKWKQYRGKIGRMTTSWITSELFGLMKESGKKVDEIAFTPENFAELLILIYEKRINSSAGQKILRYMFEHGGDPTVVMEEQDLSQLSDEGEIDAVVTKVIAENEQSVEDYKGGKEKALMYLVGQVMKETKGKVNPEMAIDLLKKQLG